MRGLLSLGRVSLPPRVSLILEGLALGVHGTRWNNALVRVEALAGWSRTYGLAELGADDCHGVRLLNSTLQLANVRCFVDLPHLLVEFFCDGISFTCSLCIFKAGT